MLGDLFNKKKEEEKNDAPNVCPVSDTSDTKEVKKEKKTPLKFLYKGVSKIKKKVSYRKQTKFLNPQDVLLKPKFTEKSATLSAKNIYVFEVDKRATKLDISRAIETIYKIRPNQVKVSKIQKKSKRNRFNPRVKGFTKTGKKAYIYLKEGDKIQLN